MFIKLLLWSFLGTIVLLVIFLITASRKKGIKNATPTPAPTKPVPATPAPPRRFSFAWLGWLVFIAVVAGGGYWGWQKYQSSKTPVPLELPVTASRKATAQPRLRPARTSKPEITREIAAKPSYWLCWKLQPGQNLVSLVSQRCMPCIIDKRDEKSLLVKFIGVRGNGTLVGNSEDGISYNGRWRDIGGWGDFNLQFSPDSEENSAIGWIKDKENFSANLWIEKK
ncbi:MAG: hypothetical protein Athens071424_108 [Parcubacteria group bacterium Athens0714_24]|nr:MAG: hypothetical protein Athens071424_108 [Parcubacteria group bacterium Athens0714_24]